MIAWWLQTAMNCVLILWIFIVGRRINTLKSGGPQAEADAYECQGCGHHATFHEWTPTSRITRPLGKCKYDTYNELSCRCQNYLGIVPLELTEGR